MLCHFFLHIIRAVLCGRAQGASRHPAGNRQRRIRHAAQLAARQSIARAGSINPGKRSCLTPEIPHRCCRVVFQNHEPVCSKLECHFFLHTTLFVQDRARLEVADLECISTYPGDFICTSKEFSVGLISCTSVPIAGSLAFPAIGSLSAAFDRYCGAASQRCTTHCAQPIPFRQSFCLGEIGEVLTSRAPYRFSFSNGRPPCM